MPHTVRGVHAFRPSEQTHGAITNIPFVGAGPTTSMRPPQAPDSSDDKHGIPPTTPIRPSHPQQSLPQLTPSAGTQRLTTTLPPAHTANSHTVLPLLVQQHCIVSKM